MAKSRSRYVSLFARVADEIECSLTENIILILLSMESKKILTSKFDGCDVLHFFFFTVKEISDAFNEIKVILADNANSDLMTIMH